MEYSISIYFVFSVVFDACISSLDNSTLGVSTIGLTTGVGDVGVGAS